MHLEIFLCILKIFVFVKLISYLGVLIGLPIIGFYIIATNLFFSKIMKLQKLTTNDLLLIGSTNTDTYNMISIFFFDKTMDKEKIRELLIEKGIKKNIKLRMRLIRWLCTYFWKEVGIEEAEKRVRFIKEEFENKEEIINYARKEVDKHINVYEELAYDFQILSYKNNQGGAVFFKLDHSLSDGLGMVTFTMTLCDDYTEDILPTVLKLNKTYPLYIRVLMEMLDFILFPYYSVRLLVNGQVHASQKNPFKRTGPPSGQTNFAYTKLYPFDHLHKINRKLDITFNDLILSIISSSISKYCKTYYPDREYIYDKLICAIPIGLKNIPKCVEEVKISNDILGAITVLRRIDDPLKEFGLIAQETRRTVRNGSNIKAWKYLAFILNQFVPAFAQKSLSENVGMNVDLGVSNLPGPTEQISYNGSKVEDIIPMMSLGFGKAFIIVGTYNNTVRLNICVDKGLDIDLNPLIKIMESEFEYVYSRFTSLLY